MIMATSNDTDLRLRDGVTRQLEWDPQVESSGIGVAVHGGTAILSGVIDSYVGKLAAERAAKRVRGVRAVANEIHVRVPHRRADAEIGQDTAAALSLAGIPARVQAAIHDGHVTLTGIVDWLYQKEAAERVVGEVRGVQNVRNHVLVPSRSTAENVPSLIAGALQRQADVDASRMGVALRGHTAVLTGTVDSWLQRETAERAVAQGPGITSVENLLTVVCPGEVPADRPQLTA
jgi:osmotically-inducible protein OsmY